MESLKSSFRQGVKDGWTLFQSPFIGMYHTARNVIRAEQGDPGIKNQFVAGLRNGWTMYWSPLMAFGKTIKSILASK
jgi:hypothetical protein